MKPANPTRLKNILLSIISVTITVGIIEAILQLADFPKEPLHPEKVFDPILLYSIPGNYPGVDADGFRNLGIPEQSDIVSLGDSHTYGYNVTREHTWPSEISKLTGLSNYNLGRGGYGPLQYYYLFDRALQLKPRYVILGLFPANDIKGVCDPYLRTTYWKIRVKREGLDLSYCDRAAEGHEGRKKNKYDKPAGLVEKASSTFFQARTVNLAWSGLSQLRSFIPIDTKGVVVFNDGKNRTIMENGHVRRHSHYTDTDREEIKKSLAVTKELLSRMFKRTEQSGAKFIVLVIPSKELVLYSHFRHKGNNLPEIYARAAANEKKLNSELLAWMESENIPAVDATAELSAMVASTGGIYPPTNDAHPIAAGYQAYARALYSSHFALHKDQTGSR